MKYYISINKRKDDKTYIFIFDANEYNLRNLNIIKNVLKVKNNFFNQFGCKFVIYEKEYNFQNNFNNAIVTFISCIPIYENPLDTKKPKNSFWILDLFENFPKQPRKNIIEITL